MPVHDWTRVEAGLFHDFHTRWLGRIAEGLNAVLPPDHYALAEQKASSFGPDVLTLSLPSEETHHTGITAVAEPAVRVRQLADSDFYVAKAKQVVIRHISGHRVVAVIEIVSPGNKDSRRALETFVTKACKLLEAGVHFVFVDLFPPQAWDKDGLHAELWQSYSDEPFKVTPEAPLLLASYRADRTPEAYLEPVAVGQALIDFPVFLNTDEHVLIPLESTYNAAYAGVPAYWRNIIEQQPTPTQGA